MGRKKSKKDTATNDKNAASMSVVEENISSNDQEMAISQKFDILTDVVENMETRSNSRMGVYGNRKKEAV